MQENKLIKLLIPLVAVVIIFESIMLVTNLEKGDASKTNSNNSQVATESAKVEEVEVPVLDLALTTTNTEMKVGKTYQVQLNLVGKNNFFVDGIETYVKYDPESVTVSGLKSSSELPKATLTKVDAIAGIIKNIVLVEEKQGYEIIKDQVNQVLTFSVTPKKEGLVQFEISTGNEAKEFVTMVVETTTTKKLPFLGSKLEINVTK